MVRNERIPDLAIYSFEAGERFEPDFLLFIRKKNSDENLIYQGYVESKGNLLLKEEAWKENFLSKIETEHKVNNILVEDYKIIGFPFFNKKNRMEEFETAVDEWLKKV